MTAPPLQPYPAYKPSGAEWPGDVPAHWDMRRLKNICRLMYGDSLPDASRASGAFPVYGSNGPVGWHSRSNTSGECIVIGRKGSFGKVHYSADPVFAIDTTFLVDSRYTDANIRWLYYLLGCLRLDEVSKDSAVPGLNREDAYQCAAFCPPLEEQAAIVRYLDDATGRLDRCRGAKARLIALLDEYRRAAIHQAVTRGLNPDVPLKPTGDPWLGAAPAHWNILSLKRLGRLNGGSGFPVHEQGRQDLELPFFKVSDMNLSGNEMEMTVWNNSVSYETATKLRANVFPPGTIIFPKVGGALLTNKRRVLQRPACIDNNLMGYAIQNGNPAFMLWLLQHIDLGTVAQPGPLPAVNEHEVGTVRVALPPPDEQAAIAEHLDRVTADIDAAIAHARREIELLDEYRASLIAAVVTGRLDVRAAASALPRDDAAANAAGSHLTPAL